MDRGDQYPVLLAVAGAVLFGASAPLSKVLLDSIDPVALAGLLYAGCGAGLAAFALMRRAFTTHREAGLAGQDLPWLAGSVIAGGIVAPVLLMLGLRGVTAATASLLLNFECVATTVIAAGIFRESIGRRVWLAIGLLTLASVLLSVDPSGSFALSPGALAVIGACLFWGIDNNLTCYLSSRDPATIGMVKGLAAGLFSLGLAVALGRPLPGLAVTLAAIGLGAVSYGLSIVLFILAARGMGAARTSAWFGSAPFAGAALSLAIFRSLPGVPFLASLPIMVAGALLLFGERHDHVHVHTSMEHDHYYAADEHHPFKETGTARHAHGEVRHAHPHRPDIHHRHGHDAGEREKRP